MDKRTDRQIALVLFAVVLGFYVRALAPDVLFGDSGEFQVAAWRLGLAHTTGYPLYLLLGSLWQHLLALVGISPAYALNLFSAVVGALAVSMLYLTLMNWLHSTAGIRRMVALLAASFFAVNPTFWSQNLIAEVYTLHACFLLLIFNLAYRLQVESGHNRALLWLALAIGFAFTHHAMTVMLLPGLLLVLWHSRPAWPRQIVGWFVVVLALLAPLLLYLYIPLRSGPTASPWYHQPLGETALTLYRNDWSSFWSFMNGQSISVGFRGLAGAIDQLAQAWLLWQLHFLLPGIVLSVLGIYVLIRSRDWYVLTLTVPLFLLQQGFNLFYNIGDILVYYIPLYLVGIIWLAFAVDAIGGGMANLEQKITAEAQAADEKAAAEPAADWREKQRAKEKRPPALAISAVLVLTIFWLPFQLGQRYYAQLDQSDAVGARAMWEPIAQATPADAILISNDRNEIVPLFYLQAVEHRMTGVTGLFPLIEPGNRFADIGATVSTALAVADERPVYLIKAMPGLEVSFSLTATESPLVRVEERPAIMATAGSGIPYGPLVLLDHRIEVVDGAVVVSLYWQVQGPLVRDYTTTVQLLDPQGNKLAQDDAPAGGRYYPTSLWKLNQTLVEQHRLSVTAVPADAHWLIGMYDSATQVMLAPPIELTQFRIE